MGGARRLFGLDYYAGIYAENGSQGMSTLGGFEVIGALAEISALSLGNMPASWACFLVYRMGLIMTINMGFVRMKGGNICEGHLILPNLVCDLSIAAFYFTSLRASPSFRLLRPKTWVSSWLLFHNVHPIRQRPLPALPLTFTTRPDTPASFTTVLSFLGYCSSLSDFLAATFPPQQSVRNMAAKLV